VVAPGHLSLPENYNKPIPNQLLPAQLADQPHSAKPPTTMGNVVNLTHPLFERYGKDLASMLAGIPVYKYWPLRVAGDSGLVLLRYGDGAPALMERNFKGPKVGKVLLWTIPLSRRPDQGGAIRRVRGCLERVPSGHVGLVVFRHDESDRPLPGGYIEGAAQLRRRRKTYSEARSHGSSHELRAEPER